MAFDAVDLEVLINLKTNAAGALEAQAAISGVRREALAAAPAVTNLGAAHKSAAAETSNFERASRNAEKAMGDLGGPLSRAQFTLSNLAGAAGFGGVGLAAIAVAAGVGAIAMTADSAIKNYEKLTKSTQALQEAYKSQGLAVDSNVRSVETFLAANKQYVDDQYAARNAIAILVRSTGDQTEAMRIASDAIDVAIAKSMPYAEAVDLLSKAVHGQARGLLDLGVSQKEINKINAEATASTKDLTKETTAAEAATDKLDKAKQHLADVEALLAGKAKLTTAQQIELRKAHEGVTAATEGLSTANAKLQAATTAASTAGKQHADILGTIEQHTRGARNAQTELEASNNRLKTDWEDLTARSGPGLTHTLDEVVKALDNGVIILGEFSDILGKIEAKTHVFSGIANVLSRIPGAAATLGSLITVGTPQAQHPNAAGGIISEPVWGVGRSGQTYSFGENGPETVIPGTGSRGGGIVVNVMVQGSVLTDTGLATAIAPKVRDELLRMARTMPNLGLS